MYTVLAAPARRSPKARLKLIKRRPNYATWALRARTKNASEFGCHVCSVRVCVYIHTYMCVCVCVHETLRHALQERTKNACKYRWHMYTLVGCMWVYVHAWNFLCCYFCRYMHPGDEPAHAALQPAKRNECMHTYIYITIHAHLLYITVHTHTHLYITKHTHTHLTFFYCHLCRYTHPGDDAAHAQSISPASVAPAAVSSTKTTISSVQVQSDPKERRLQTLQEQLMAAQQRLAQAREEKERKEKMKQVCLVIGV
jgi:hypothetical protein